MPRFKRGYLPVKEKGQSEILGEPVSLSLSIDFVKKHFPRKLFAADGMVLQNIFLHL
jgi:hypothetical protein